MRTEQIPTFIQLTFKSGGTFWQNAGDILSFGDGWISTSGRGGRYITVKETPDEIRRKLRSL